MNENASEPVVSERAQRFARLVQSAIRWIIAAAVLLVPIASVAITEDPRFIKVTLVEIAAIAALVLFLLAAFVERRIAYRWSAFHSGLVAFGAILVLATIFSPDPVGSFWGGPDATGETVAFLVSVIALALIASAVFGDSRGAGGLEESSPRHLLAIAFLGGFLLLAFEFLVATLLGGYVSLPAALGNPVGTGRALSLMLAAGFALGLGVFLPIGAHGRMDRLTRWLAGGVGVLSIAALLFLAYRDAWLAVALASAVYIALAVVKSYPRDVFSGGMISLAGIGVAFAALAVGLFLAFVPVRPFQGWYDPPAEIAPSFRETARIAGRVLVQGRIFGSGPATFLADYHRFRDPALNDTPLWAVRFVHGSSVALTFAATLGIVGVAVFLGTILSGLVLGIRRFLNAPVTPLACGLLGAFIVLSFLAFLAPSTAVSQFFLLIIPGLLIALLPVSAAAPAVAVSEESPRVPFPWSDPRALVRGLRLRFPSAVRQGNVVIRGAGGTFVASLATVFASAFTLIACWALAMQYAGEVAYARGVRAFNVERNFDAAEAAFLAARARHGSESRVDLAIARAAIARLQAIIGQAAAGATPELQERFRDALTLGSEATERATARDPEDPAHWIARGELFETVIPFLAGADQVSSVAYREAKRADPIDPTIPFAEARLRITVADLLTLQINETVSGEDRSRLEARRLALWEEAAMTLEDSLALKPDYAAAHFLLAQLAIRRDDLDEAIRKSEEVARLAPADVGVAFQLGVLYYRAGDLDRAKAEFERAVLYDENYSNARYFLGLIWDRLGDPDAALSQFQKIIVLNPGNEEVARIIRNLETGRPALDGIAPPAAAPDERREVPVPEAQ